MRSLSSRLEAVEREAERQGASRGWLDWWALVEEAQQPTDRGEDGPPVEWWVRVLNAGPGLEGQAAQEEASPRPCGPGWRG
jgi:hypothetical protein